MNHNELTNHLNRLRPQRPAAQPAITWETWFQHCADRSDYAAERIRHHQANPSRDGAELITWGVVAASLADNNNLTRWIDRYLTNLWELAATANNLTRNIHPVDHVLSLASQRQTRNVMTQRRRRQRDHDLGRQLASNDTSSDPTSDAAIARVELATISSRCHDLTGQSASHIVDLALAANNNTTERQRLHRSRRALRTLVAA